jgi:hypothetical protein
MNGLSQEQRNPYKGSPPRSWIRLSLLAKDGTVETVELVADTGCPYEVIVSQALMNRFQRRRGLAVASNFGTLAGGWLEVTVPDLSFRATLSAFASDAVVASTQTSSSDFQGLIGLPLLRRFVYGGDDQCFWLQMPSGAA